MGRKGILLAEVWRMPGSFPEQSLSKRQNQGSFNLWEQACWGLRCGSDGKESACSAGDWGLIPGSGRSPGGGHGYPLQYSCLENPMDTEAWWSTESQGFRHEWVTRIFTLQACSCRASAHGRVQASVDWSLESQNQSPSAWVTFQLIWSWYRYRYLFFIIFPLLSYYKILSVVPCAIE